MSYRVSEIFESIQGEGLWTGTWMTFVRLQGCDLGCSFCDTKHTWPRDGGTEMSVAEMVAACERTRVCLTGGEPAMWDLEPLARALKDAGHVIHLETSGRHALCDRGLIDWITLSPKPPDWAVGAAFLDRANELKYVVCDEFDPAVLPDRDGVPVFLQPCDGGGYDRSLRKTVALTRELGLPISIQTHRILGMR